MHFGPIFRSLMHNKSRFWLITLEVALTLAIVVNCINMMLDIRYDYIKPSGYDEENLIVVYTEPFSPEFKEEGFVDQVRIRDLDRLRAMPGVVAAAGIHQIPLSGSGSATGRKPLGEEMDSLGAPYYVVTDGALETLGVELIAGRDFQPGDFDYDEGAVEAGEPEMGVIVSKKLADALFPEGDALGQLIESGSGERVNPIIGIVAEMQNSWPNSKELDGHVMLFPGKPGGGGVLGMRYMVRTEPGAVDAVYADLEGLMRELQADRVITVRTLTEVKNRQFSGELGVTKLLTTVIGLLIFVTAMGIVGLTSFSVTQRTRQIGTRRALGASKGDIVWYFLVENWMITGFGLLLGLFLTYGLNYALVSFADGAKLDLKLVAAGALLLWVTGILAALVPAIRATGVAPEVATRTV
jgi:putative ABC transport system permease protein